MKLSGHFHASAVLTLEGSLLITIGYAQEQVWLWDTANFIYIGYLHVPYSPTEIKRPGL
jgi:hypothetical protein